MNLPPDYLKEFLKDRRHEFDRSGEALSTDCFVGDEGRALKRVLQDFGIISRSGQLLRPHMKVNEFRDLILCTDYHDSPHDDRLYSWTDEAQDVINALDKHSLAEPKTVLDLGTGCGTIALALANRFPSADVIGTDKSVRSIEIAKMNLVINAPIGNRARHRVSFLGSDLFKGLEQRKFDLIVCDPVIRFAPGSDHLVNGLSPMPAEILEKAPTHLTKQGTLLLLTYLVSSEKVVSREHIELCCAAFPEGCSVDFWEGR